MTVKELIAMLEKCADDYEVVVRQDTAENTEVIGSCAISVGDSQFIITSYPA